MLTGVQVKQFERNGFLNAGPLLRQEELEELCEQLSELLAKGPDGFRVGQRRPVSFCNMASETGKEVVQVVNVWEVCPAFERLMHHPFIVRAIAKLTGFSELQVWHDQVQYKPAQAGGATAWHQDAPLWPSIKPDTPVSAWLPFDDADIENGCMWMVPGSHRWGNRIDMLTAMNPLVTREEFAAISEVDFTPPASAPIQEIRPVPCPVKRGEVHFHHSLTWHGSPQNVSARARRAIAIHYMTSEAQYTGRDHVMKPFIQVEVGGPMSQAGDRFRIVCRGGQPVNPPANGSRRR